METMQTSRTTNQECDEFDFSRDAIIDDTNLSCSSPTTAASDDVVSPSQHCNCCSLKHQQWPLSLPLNQDSKSSKRPIKKEEQEEEQKLFLLQGFKKASLPLQVSVDSSQPHQLLRRLSSDIVNSPGLIQKARESFVEHPIRRTISDPNPTPEVIPPVPSRRKLEKEESPDAKRLKRMKEKMMEINQWIEQVMKEGEDCGIQENNKSITMDVSGAQTEELVSVELMGEGIIIHFKCHCSKRYQILIIRENIYYKIV